MFMTAQNLAFTSACIDNADALLALHTPPPQDGGYWNKGISACAVCDGAAPIFRNKVHL